MDIIADGIPIRATAGAQGRAARAMMVRLATLWATAAGTLWLHALLGIPGDYLGQGFPLYPGLKVTGTGLALTALSATLPIPLVAAPSRHLRLRWLALPPVVLLWLLATADLIAPFTIDFGTTWTMTDAVIELFLHPLHTPLALALFAAVAAWSLAPPKTG